MSENVFTTMLIGEFAGKVYNYSKIIPVINSLHKTNLIDKRINDFYKNLAQYDCADFLIYFNPETKVIFGLEINHNEVRPILLVYKSFSQGWEEVREVCNKAYALIPGLTIQVKDESFVKPENKKIVA